MMSLKRAILALALGAGCVGLMVNAAQAAVGDTQFISSAAVSACVNGGHTGSLAYEWDGLYNKSSSQAVHLDCSQHNSTEHVEHSHRLTSMLVVVRDGHSSDNITCSMKVVTAAGTVVFESGPSGTTNTGSVILNFIVPSWVAGSAYAACRLPPKQGSSMSGIVSVVTTGTIGS